jgi:hypothetical protein
MEQSVSITRRQEYSLSTTARRVGPKDAFVGPGLKLAPSGLAIEHRACFERARLASIHVVVYCSCFSWLSFALTNNRHDRREGELEGDSWRRPTGQWSVYAWALGLRE